MTLRKKSLLIVVSVLLIMTALLLAIAWPILMIGFNELENRDVSNNVSRATNAINDEVVSLTDNDRDWASWDETYAFIADGNVAYIQSNLATGTSFVNNQVNLMIFVNREGQVICSQAYDLQQKAQIAATSGMTALAANPVLLGPGSGQPGVSGIVMLPEGPMLVSSQPILTSRNQGPARGTLIWGRYLDAALVDKLSRNTQLSLAIQPWLAAGIPADFASAAASLMLPQDDQPASGVDSPQRSPYIAELGGGNIAGYTVLPSVSNAPALLVRIDQPRDIHNQGIATLRYLIISLIAVGLVTGAATILPLERWVLSRISRLSRDVSKMGKGSCNGRVEVSGQDELARLSADINGMLDRVDQSRQKLSTALGDEHLRREELASLYSLSRALADSPPQGELALETIAHHAVTTIRVTYACIMQVRDVQFVVTAAWPGRNVGGEMFVGRSYPFSHLPVCREMLGAEGPVVLMRDDPRLSESERFWLFSSFAHTICAVPLRSGSRELGLLLLAEQRTEKREPFDREKLRLAGSIGDQAVSTIRRAELFNELEQSYLETVTALANAVDAKDSYTAGHGRRMADIAVALGKKMRLQPEKLDDLRFGAILHDIGKIGIPDELLGKRGRLTREECALMYRHPEIGQRIVMPVSRLQGAGKIIRSHHERFDGYGYPDGLSGRQIPLTARVLAVVDAYLAMVDERAYKASMDPEQALAELRSSAGTQFDPEVVADFIGLMESERRKVASQAAAKRK